MWTDRPQNAAQADAAFDPSKLSIEELLLLKRLHEKAGLLTAAPEAIEAPASATTIEAKPC